MYPRADQTYIPDLSPPLPIIPTPVYATAEVATIRDFPVVYIRLYDRVTGRGVYTEIVGGRTLNPLTELGECMRREPKMGMFSIVGPPRITSGRYMMVRPTYPVSTFEKDVRRAYYAPTGVKAGQPDPFGDAGLRLDPEAVKTFLAGENNGLPHERSDERRDDQR